LRTGRRLCHLFGDFHRELCVTRDWSGARQESFETKKLVFCILFFENIFKQITFRKKISLFVGESKFIYNFSETQWKVIFLVIFCERIKKIRKFKELACNPKKPLKNGVSTPHCSTGLTNGLWDFVRAHYWTTKY
jgi:hypothetical protein